MQVVYAPTPYSFPRDKISIFLGGSIELGQADNWQQRLTGFLTGKPYSDKLVLLNPRREDWDQSIPTQDPDHPVLAEQINWELVCQDKADLVIYFFAADTISPITLFELGLYRDRQPVVGASPAYKRYGNLKLTAKHFGFPVHTGWDNFLRALNLRLSSLCS